MSADLQDLIAEVWQATLGLSITPVEEQPVGNQSFAGIVQIGGEWHGALVVVGGPEMARRAASLMFSRDIDHLERDEIADAWGELSNMVAGLIKAQLRGSNAISLPIVIQGASYNLGVLGCNVLFNQIYQCDDALFSVALFERRPTSE